MLRYWISFDFFKIYLALFHNVTLNFSAYIYTWPDLSWEGINLVISAYELLEWLYLDPTRYFFVFPRNEIPGSEYERPASSCVAY